MRSGPNEPCPPSSWDPCFLSRWRGWRAAVEWWSRRRLSNDFARFDVTEFNVLDFVDRLPNRSAGCVTMTIDFAQRVVSARLGACQHSIDALDDIDFAFNLETAVEVLRGGGMRAFSRA